MNKKLNMMLLAVAGLFTACDGYDFDQEQYRHDISLLSNSDLIYDRQVASLDKEDEVVYVVATLSGSQPSSQPHKVTLIPDDSLFNAYNKSNFDIKEQFFAKKLPAKNYEMPSLEMEIPAGASKVMFPVHLKNLHEISPDSTYFLDFKLDRENMPNCNWKKSHVLLRIFKENYFATTKQPTFYNYTSTTIVIPSRDPHGSAEVRRPTSSNRVAPIGAKSVRMTAGDEELGDFKHARANIVKKSIILEMGDKLPENPAACTVTIKPHPATPGLDANPIDVVQLTPINEYDNTFVLNTLRTADGRATYYKEFRLHYKYRLNPDDVYKEVKAVLRLEYNPRVDNL